MSFNQGLSGLNSAAKNLDVIGNNIANTSTVGFKASRAEFGDVYAASLFGTGKLDAGIGTKTVAVAQQFTQGGISVTNNPMDVAISGNGFFRLNSANGTSYTRNGQFHTDKDGFLLANTGENVTGYTKLTLDSNLNVTGASNLGNLQINLNDINATATSQVNLVLNLASAVVGSSGDHNVLLGPPAPLAFDQTNSNTYNYSTSVTIYDSLGADHALTLYFVRDSSLDPAIVPPATASATAGWKVYGYLDGTTTQVDMAPNAPPAAPPFYNVMQFGLSGVLASGSIITGVTQAVAGASDLLMDFDFTGTTQYAGSSGINSVTQNGYQSGSLVGLNIEDSGIVFGRYSNGVSKPLQQVVLTTFRNPQALIPTGDNQWVATFSAGSETVNKPGEGVAGALQSGAVEESNTDLTAALVDMIVAQRMYQANAQTVKTQDQLLQTLVNLR